MVSGDVAYVANGVRGLQMVDVSDPVNPVLIGGEAEIDITRDVAVAGNLAYLADGLGGFFVVDVSDPSNPATQGILWTPGEARGLAIFGEAVLGAPHPVVYLADVGSGLQVIDVGYPDPTIIGSIDIVLGEVDR